MKARRHSRILEIVCLGIALAIPTLALADVRVLGIWGNDAATDKYIGDRAELGLRKVRSETEKKADNGNLIVRLPGKPVSGDEILLYLPTTLSPDQWMDALIKIQTARSNGARSVTVVCDVPLGEVVIKDSEGQPIPLALEPYFRTAGADDAREGTSELLPAARRLSEAPRRSSRETGTAVVASIGHPELAKALATGMKLSYAEPLETVRAQHIYLVVGAGPATNENFAKALSVVERERSKGNTIHLVMPYLFYARSDKIDQPGVGITVALVARELETAGVEEITVMRAHSAQSLGAFTIPFKNLSGRSTLRKYLVDAGVTHLIAPDGGAGKEVEKMAELLGLPSDVATKVRNPLTGEVVSLDLGPIQIEGETVAILDDELASGKTAKFLTDIVVERYHPAKIIVVATHLAGSAERLLQSENFEKLEVVVTDTIPIPRDQKKVKVVSAAGEILRHLLRREIDRTRRSEVSIQRVIKTLFASLGPQKDLGPTLTPSGSTLLAWIQNHERTVSDPRFATNFLEVLSDPLRRENVSPFDVLILTREILGHATYSPELVETVSGLYESSPIFRHVWQQKASFSGTPAASLHQKISHSLPTSEIETFDVRPDILELSHGKDALSNPGRNWKELSRAAMEFSTMLLEMYPDRHLVFAGRDGESYFDFARLIAQGDPKTLRRLHLFSMSKEMRAHRDPNAGNYLRQVLTNNDPNVFREKFLYVDVSTASSNTFKAIRSAFPQDLQDHLGGHVIVSRDPIIPSSRTAVLRLVENIEHGSVDENQARLYLIGRVEIDSPHYTNRAAGFLWDVKDHKWNPYSAPTGEKEKANAVRRMEFLKAFYDQPEIRAVIARRQVLWREARQRIMAGKQLELYRWLLEIYDVASETEKPFLDAFAGDVLDIARTNYAKEFGPIAFAASLDAERAGRTMGTIHLLIADEIRKAELGKMALGGCDQMRQLAN